MASYRFVWHPKWVAGHLLVIAAVITMVLLGKWQLTVSNRKHFNLQNFGYALQWWAFCICAVAFWGKILRDRARPQSAPSHDAEPAAAPAEAPAYRRYVPPSSADETDPEIARYNAYLAALAERDER